MKNRILTRTSLLAGMAALNFAFLPTLQAQTTSTSPTNPTGSEANSKATEDSAAQQRSGSTSTASTPASAPDKTSSKDLTSSLDKNPSTTPSDSANASATKEPTTATTEDRMAQNKKSDKGEAKEAFSDKHFLVKAAQGGMTEVELGQIAQQKGNSDEVKKFGATMVSDHTQANNELKGLAQQKGITVSTKLDASHQATVDRFNKLSGADFDRAYVHDMVEDHQKDAAEFEQASTSAKDPDVKAFATKTLAVVKNHLAHVQTLQSEIK